MRVLICDDHRLFAEVFAFVLGADGHDVVGCVTSPDDAVRFVASADVEICVMDLHFPTGSGLDGIARVMEASPATRVVALTGSSACLHTAANAGAHGVAVKNHDVRQVIRILERVHAGELVMEALLWPGGSEASPVTAGKGPAQFLTGREREVLERLVSGASTADLAEAMEVTISTARSHVQKVLTKLGVHSKLEAVALAVNQELVAIP